jgi:hypothetical protein
MSPATRRWLRLGAFAAVGIAAFVGWLGAGLLVLLSFEITAVSGQQIALGVLQVLSLVGWLAILIWLVVDLGKANPRFVLAPFAAWIWVFLVLVFVGNIATGFGP